MASETPFSQLPCVWWHIVIDNAASALQREQQKNHLYEHSRRRSTQALYTDNTKVSPLGVLQHSSSWLLSLGKRSKNSTATHNEPKKAMADATAAPAAASKAATAQCPSQRGRCRHH